MAKSGFSRRDFLKVIGAGSGLAATGCGKDLPEKLIPYVVQPDEVIPGVATWYAGSCNECSSGCGTVIRTRDGRATKAEGNPHHPVNKGALCAIGQASIQAHYDPDRVREPLKRDVNGPFKTIGWKEVVEEVATNLKATSGKEVVLLTQPLSGSIRPLIGQFGGKFTNFSHIQFDALGDDALNEGAKRVFGDGVSTHFDFSKAETIVSFGADYLETWGSPVEYHRQWAEGRTPRVDGGKARMSYSVHFAPRLSPTGGSVDKFIMNRAGSEAYLLAVVLKQILEKKSGQLPGDLVGKLKVELAPFTLEAVAEKTGVEGLTLTAVIERLLESETSLVVAGGTSCSAPFPVECAALANLINAALGNIGRSVILRAGEKGRKPAVLELAQLGTAVLNGQKKLGAVIISGANPLFNLPSQHPFVKAIGKAESVISVSSQLDETTNFANYVLPLSTNFEAWNDSEPAPGVYNLNQPAMAPLYQTLSLGDALLAIGLKLELSIEGVKNFEDYIKLQWKKRTGEADFASKWDKFVEKGGDYFNPITTSLKPAFQAVAMSLKAVADADLSGKMLLAFPTTLTGDGKGANRPWLQEIPYPMTTSVWGSWAEIHPDTAAKYDVNRKDVMEVQTVVGGVEAPTYYTKFIHPDLVAIPLGNGHEAYGRYAAGVGSNPIKALAYKGDEVVVPYLVPLRSDKVTLDERTQYETKSKPIYRTLSKENLVILSGNRDEPVDSQLGRGLLRSIPLAKITQDNSKSLKDVRLGQQHQEEGHQEHAEGHGGEHGGEHGGGHHDPFALGPQAPAKQMYEQMDHPLYRWGMTIDLNSCTGCSACVVACYAENNIAVVGKEICGQGREMSWLRIERYFDGDDDQPLLGFLPMLCQHCNNAPCEPVCPVYATYHNEEGINSMVYNRCVGTRYCNNNCSYKVRRFNFFKYDWPEPLTWQLNPDVTVRSVGVMEKCSFCIQRIHEAKFNAKAEGRTLREGEVLTACQQSCPTGAIRFGNLLDENSRVAQETKSERGYKILDQHINTQPAITYHAKVKHGGHAVEHAKNSADQVNTGRERA